MFFELSNDSRNMANIKYFYNYNQIEFKIQAFCQLFDPVLDQYETFVTTIEKWPSQMRSVITLNKILYPSYLDDVWQQWTLQQQTYYHR